MNNTLISISFLSIKLKKYYSLSFLLPCAVSAAPTELIPFYLRVPRVLFEPLALSPPWAMQEYRPYRAHLRLSNQYTLLF